MQNTKINQDYLKTRMEQIKKQREENSRFISLKNGENVIEIDLTVLPVLQPPKNGYKERMLWTTTTQKNGRNLLLSASLPLDALIVKALSEGYNPFTLIKVGEGINTRYAVKELESN